MLLYKHWHGYVSTTRSACKAIELTLEQTVKFHYPYIEQANIHPQHQQRQRMATSHFGESERSIGLLQAAAFHKIPEDPSLVGKTLR